MSKAQNDYTAQRKYYESHQEELKAYHRQYCRDKYFNNTEYRLNKLKANKEKVYIEGTLKYIRRLFEENTVKPGKYKNVKKLNTKK